MFRSPWVHHQGVSTWNDFVKGVKDHKICLCHCQLLCTKPVSVSPLCILERGFIPLLFVSFLTISFYEIHMKIWSFLLLLLLRARHLTHRMHHSLRLIVQYWYFIQHSLNNPAPRIKRQKTHNLVFTQLHYIETLKTLHGISGESIHLTSLGKTPTPILYTATIWTRSNFCFCENNRGSANCQRALFIL